MVTSVTLITSNPNKAREFTSHIPGLQVLRHEYVEIQSEDPSEVSAVAAGSLAGMLGKVIVVEDSGLFIDSLHGFPGTFTKQVTATIGNDGLLKLMRGVKNRKCYYKSVIGFCAPGQKPVCFVGIEQGKIALKAAGKNGWGNDPIFIPKGSSKTYSQIKQPGQSGKFRIDAIKKLKDFLAAGNY